MLQRQVRGVHRQMDMGVDEAGTYRPVREVDHPRTGRPPDRALDLCDPITIDENLGGTCQEVGKAIKSIAADQNEHNRLRVSLQVNPFGRLVQVQARALYRAAWRPEGSNRDESRLGVAQNKAAHR